MDRYSKITHKIVAVYPNGTVFEEGWTSEEQATHFAQRLLEHEERRLAAGIIEEVAQITVIPL